MHFIMRLFVNACEMNFIYLHFSDLLLIQNFEINHGHLYDVLHTYNIFHLFR